MKIRNLADQFYFNYLANNSASNFTQDWAKRNGQGERVAFLIFGHASVSVTFNVQIASDSSGTGAASIFTDYTALASGKMAARAYDAGQLTAAKQFSSALVTRSAGNYSLLEMRYALREEGNVTQATSVSSIVELLT